jgi:hypothetical protein
MLKRAGGDNTVHYHSAAFFGIVFLGARHRVDEASIDLLIEANPWSNRLAP